MNSRRTIIYLMLIMLAVAVTVGGVSIGVLYNAAFDERRAGLVQTVQSQARLLEVMYRHQVTENRKQALQITIDQISEAHQQYDAFGESGEFVLAGRDGENIAFVLRHRKLNFTRPKPIPINSKYAEPMRRAISGQSGSIIGLDYRGVEVLAAYEPVAVLGLGMVAKIDLAEVRAPFVRAGLIIALTATVLIALGTLLFGMISNPMLLKIVESEERFRDFARSGADQLWETDTGHRFVYVSDAPEESPWYSTRQLLGKTRWEIGLANHDGEYWEKHRADLDARRPFQDFRFSRGFAGGRVTYLRASGIPIYDQQGNFKGYRGTVTDETDIVEAQLSTPKVQNQFHEAINQSTDGIVLWDAGGRLVMCNDEYRNIYAHLTDMLKPGLAYEEFIEHHVASGKVAEAAGREKAFIAERLQGIKDKEGRVEEVKTGARWYRHRRQYLPDGSIITFHTDITEEKARDEQLQQALKMEAVGQLTGGIAHDFNNMLAGLQGNLDLISDASISEAERQQRLQRAKSIIRRGADLTRHLLAFSRKQILQPQPTDVGILIDHMQDLMRRSLGETITINMDFSDHLWPAQVDPLQLENAILNLAINARDAMPGGGDLWVRGHNIADGGKNATAATALPLEMAAGDYVAISVEDTGRGIPEDQIKNVFDPFFTTKDVGEGSGLGLSMVYGFAKQSGGYVAIESTEGAGTKVSLFLPRAEAVREENPMDAALPEPARGQGERIMVIEDDPDVRDVTTAALQRLGYRVIDGGDGLEALRIGNEQAEGIDLLLTDVVLPHGNSGPDLAAALAKKWRHMKILVMTGYAEADILGASGDTLKHVLIQKPFRTAELSKQIQELLTERDG